MSSVVAGNAVQRNDTSITTGENFSDAQCPGADKAHITAQDVPELWEFIQRGCAQPFSDPRNTCVLSGCLAWPMLLVGVGHHGAKLEDRKSPPPLSHALVIKKDRTAIIPFDHGSDEAPHRQ